MSERDDAPERIYLQPACCATPDVGRMWCEDPDPVDCEDGVPWTEYVRADRPAPSDEGERDIVERLFRAAEYEGCDEDDGNGPCGECAGCTYAAAGMEIARLRAPKPTERELLCQMCGRDYPCWSADSDLWNEVMRAGDRGAADEYQFVCPTCFTVKAAFMGVATYSFLSRNPKPTEQSRVHAPTCPQSIPYEVGSGAPYGCTCRESKPTERDIVVKHEWDQRLADVAGRMKSYGYDAETLRVLVDHILGGAEVPMPTEPHHEDEGYALLRVMGGIADVPTWCESTELETGEVERLREALEALNDNVGDLANSAVRAKVRRALDREEG